MNNNPVKFVDPSGHRLEERCDIGDSCDIPSDPIDPDPPVRDNGDYMENKLHPLAIPAILTWLLLSGYYTYCSWFDKNKLIESLKKKYEQLPSWYPTRDYSLSNIGTKNWLRSMRLFSTFNMIVATLLLLAIIYNLLR